MRKLLLEAPPRIGVRGGALPYLEDRMALIPLADVLSITADRLLSRRHMDGVYDLLRHMTGQDVYTHQIPAVADACIPALIEQHPFLADLKPPDDIDQDDVFVWLAEAERVHGDELEVAPLSAWNHRDPSEDAADLVGADRVWRADGFSNGQTQ